MRITKIAVLTGALVIGLTGCTFSANFTVSADKIAELAAGALTEPLGFTPEITCDPADVPLVEGE